MNQVTSSTDNLSICAVVERAQANKLAQIAPDGNCIAIVNEETFIYILILAAFGTSFSVIISFLLSIVNQKTMTVFSFLVAAGAGVGLLFTTDRYLMAVLFCSEVSLAGYTMVLVNGTAVSLFPTHIRAMAVSLSMMMARLSSFTFSSLVGLIMQDYCEATFYMFSGILVVGASLIVFLPKKN